MLNRRALLAAAAGLPLVACDRGAQIRYTGGWVGARHDRGHMLREKKSGSLPAPSISRRASVVVVGAGVAGLACVRSLVHEGIDDVHLLELEDDAGGNSRGHRIAGMACPLGAHYLPVPGEAAVEIVELLEELNLSRIEFGRRIYDERHLCHSPQERLFIGGRWQEGLLPVQGQTPETLAEYRRFSTAVARVKREAGFAIPTANAPWTPAHDALDAVTMGAWLDTQGFRSPSLRTYLDYCCRDDYGAGLAQVSAWAGLHYFASRHGFQAPGTLEQEPDAVLTWPEGNAWLTERMAGTHKHRLHTGMVALRVSEERHEVALDLWNTREQRSERWIASRVVLATPLFIAARLLNVLSPALQSAVQQMRYAPWLVANLHLRGALVDRGGAPPAWDNVIHGSPLLGYVNAMHQRTLPFAGPTVLTVYWALGGNSGAQLQTQRTRLLQDDWPKWAQAVVSDLLVAHPDLPAQLLHIDLMRYGHAMSIPLPGVRGSSALRALVQTQGRVLFAHSDLSGYSVFEEAFGHGMNAGRRCAGYFVKGS